MDFLLEYSKFILEHKYDSVVNQQLGFPVSKDSKLQNLLDYISQMISQNQVKDIIKHDDTIDFTINTRKYSINKNGILSQFKTRSSDVEIKNIDVLEWIFGNKDEALDALKSLYSNRVRTINKFEIDSLRELNKKVGKKSEKEFNSTFKSAKKTKREEQKVDTEINKEISLDIYNKLSKILF